MKYGYIYLTKNILNGKIYIGQHKTDLYNPNYTGSGILIKKAIKKYGKENFVNGIIEWCDTKSDLTYKEIYWISHYNMRQEGYNISMGGDSGRSGVPWSEESKIKRRENGLKTNLRERQRQAQFKVMQRTGMREKISNSVKKTTNTTEWKKTASDRTKKMYEDRPEIKEKISEGQKGRIPWNKGLINIYTEEQLKKISDNTKKGMSDTKVREKISKANKGKVAWNKGKKTPDEVKRKQSESHKGQIAWNKGLKKIA